MRNHLARFVKDDSGQAIVEFVLLIFASVLIMTSMKVYLKRITIKLWQVLAKRIAAPCPACDAGADFDL